MRLHSYIRTRTRLGALSYFQFLFTCTLSLQIVLTVSTTAAGILHVRLTV